jgi:hypothetical protein
MISSWGLFFRLRPVVSPSSLHVFCAGRPAEVSNAYRLIVLNQVDYAWFEGLKERRRKLQAREN